MRRSTLGLQLLGFASLVAGYSFLRGLPLDRIGFEALPAALMAAALATFGFAVFAYSIRRNYRSVSPSVAEMVLAYWGVFFAGIEAFAAGVALLLVACAGLLR
jgi:hypothetical protein